MRGRHRRDVSHISSKEVKRVQNFSKDKFYPLMFLPGSLIAERSMENCKALVRHVQKSQNWQLGLLEQKLKTTTSPKCYGFQCKGPLEVQFDSNLLEILA